MGIAPMSKFILLKYSTGLARLFFDSEESSAEK